MTVGLPASASNRRAANYIEILVNLAKFEVIKGVNIAYQDFKMVRLPKSSPDQRELANFAHHCIDAVNIIQVDDSGAFSGLTPL